MASGTKQVFHYDTLLERTSITGNSTKTLSEDVGNYDFVCVTVFDGTGSNANGMTYYIPKPLYGEINKVQIPATDSTAFYIRTTVQLSGTTATISNYARAGYGGCAMQIVGARIP